MSSSLTTYSDSHLCMFLALQDQHKNEAFAEIYRRYHQRLYAYILKITGNPDETKDIFQEMFVKFMKSMVTHNHEKSPIVNGGAFLLIIARNLCLNYKRTQKSTVDLEDYHLVSNDLPRYEQEELLNYIQTALEYLDFDYREAFVLRLYHDLSYEEIADITHTTVPTIKNRVWRAKEKIRKILAPVLADFDSL